MDGRLELYQDDPPLPLFISNNESSRAILCIGGMGDGFLALPYLHIFNDCVVQVLLSSSYNQWGMQSLTSDAEEIMNAVQHLSAKFSEIVLLGHSTGCQDVVHVLRTQQEHPAFKVITKAILQAPVSDREGFGMHYDLQESIDHARTLEPEQLMDRKVLGKVDIDVPMTARRWLSVSTKNGQDDYFSSDVSFEPLRTLPIPCLFLLGQDDEFVPSNDWQHAWSSPTSTVHIISGNHKVSSPEAQLVMKTLIDEFIA